jgi:hypothetical protein
MGDTLPGQCGSLCAVEGVPCASLQIALDGASPFDLGIDQPADFAPVPNPGETLDIGVVGVDERADLRRHLVLSFAIHPVIAIRDDAERVHLEYRFLL